MPSAVARHARQTNKKPGGCRAFCRKAERLRALDVARLLALRAGRDFELHLLAFLQGFEARHVDCREVREQILTATIGSDEAETLGVVEPLHSTCCHLRYFLKNNKTGDIQIFPG